MAFPATKMTFSKLSAKEPLILHTATEADLESLASLMAEFRDSLQKQAPSDADIRVSLRALLGESSGVYGVAQQKGRAVGYFFLRQQYSAWACGKEAVLEDLYVSEEARGQGAGRRLVEYALASAKRSGCRSVSLDTNEKNEFSNRLYRNLGFTCERPRWAGGRQIRFDKRLD